MTDFEKYVDDSDECVYAFRRACEDMSDVKFITAERKISELLMLIATSSKLQAIVANASRGFDFKEAFVKARVKAGKRFSLLPPVKPRELIAFAVNLLFAFDTRAVDLQDFLEEYYYSGNGIGFAFTAFSRNVIVPLGDAVVGELRAFSENARVNTPASSEPVYEVEPYIPEEAVTDIVNRIADICDIAEQSAELTQEEREEIYSISGGLADSVRKQDIRMVRTLTVGLRGVIRSCGMADYLGEKADELEETLRHFGV